MSKVNLVVLNEQARNKALAEVVRFAEDAGHEGDLTVIERAKRGEVGFFFAVNGRVAYVGYDCPAIEQAMEFHAKTKEFNP